MLKNVIESNGVSLENKEEENLDKFVDVLVEFAKHFSVADIVNKIVRMREYKLDFSRPVLTNMINKKLESKVEADPAFLNVLHADNQKALESFVKQLEDRKKAEEEAAAKQKADEAAKAEESPEVEEEPPTDPNRDILEEGLQILDALIENEDEVVDFDTLVTMLRDAWDKIQTYPKPEHGIPVDLAAKIADFTQNLTNHVSKIDAGINDIKLLISVWDNITGHLGIEAPFELDTTEAQKSDELQAFVVTYLVQNWNAGEELEEDVREAREDSIAERVKDIFKSNEELDEMSMFSEICLEFDGLDGDDLAEKWEKQKEA